MLYPPRRSLNLVDVLPSLKQILLKNLKEKHLLKRSPLPQTLKIRKRRQSMLFLKNPIQLLPLMPRKRTRAHDQLNPNQREEMV
jgi:hypothetical protein